MSSRRNKEVKSDLLAQLESEVPREFPGGYQELGDEMTPFFSEFPNLSPILFPSAVVKVAKRERKGAAKKKKRIRRKIVAKTGVDEDNSASIQIEEIDSDSFLDDFNR